MKVVHIKKGVPYVWSVKRYKEVGNSRYLIDVALFSTWEAAKEYADAEIRHLEFEGKDLANMLEFKESTTIINGTLSKHNLEFDTMCQWVRNGLWYEYYVVLTEMKIY